MLPPTHDKPGGPSPASGTHLPEQYDLENNKARMDYPAYRREGLPVSTAMVESLIKEGLLRQLAELSIEEQVEQGVVSRHAVLQCD